MIKTVLNKLKATGLFITVFLLFWFLNSGFLLDPLWLVGQAAFFTVICYTILRNRKIGLNHWFFFVGFLYIVSATFEMFKMKAFSEIASSTGFGVLVIYTVYRVFNKGQPNGQL